RRAGERELLAEHRGRRDPSGRTTAFASCLLAGPSQLGGAKRQREERMRASGGSPRWSAAHGSARVAWFIPSAQRGLAMHLSNPNDPIRSSASSSQDNAHTTCSSPRTPDPDATGAGTPNTPPDADATTSRAVPPAPQATGFTPTPTAA